MEVFIVKYASDRCHPAEWYIDSIWESEEDAKERIKEMRHIYPYDTWIDEEYVELKKPKD